MNNHQKVLAPPQLLIRTQKIWSEEELRAYLLLYAANADFIFKAEERSFIHQRVEGAVLEKMTVELMKDNGYRQVQKILNTLDQLQYSNQQINQLLDDMEAVFRCDDEYTILEQNAYYSMKRLLRCA